MSAETLLEFTVCTMSFILVGGTIIFLMIFFSPLITEYLYPWTREQRIHNMSADKGFPSLNNFRYRVVFYKYNLDRGYFQRLWFFFSLASAAIYIFSLFVGILMDSVVCLAASLLAGVVLHILLIRRVESRLALRYELSHRSEDDDEDYGGA